MAFAVIDVETTGPGCADRVVEVAVVLLDDALNSMEEFDTLGNPLRDVAQSHDPGAAIRERHPGALDMFTRQIRPTSVGYATGIR
jgi:DNA polymerase III epsilon subunit-like protein